MKVENLLETDDDRLKMMTKSRQVKHHIILSQHPAN
jgi:hypothetical protein